MQKWRYRSYMAIALLEEQIDSLILKLVYNGIKKQNMSAN